MRAWAQDVLQESVDLGALGVAARQVLGQGGQRQRGAGAAGGRRLALPGGLRDLRQPESQLVASRERPLGSALHPKSDFLQSKETRSMDVRRHLRILALPRSE